MSQKFTRLVAWQRADDLFIEVHRYTHQHFPVHERYELGRQIRRAGHSVPSNIVEGNARYHRREKLHFFNIASASLSELAYRLHAAHRLGYIGQADYLRLDDLAKQVAAPLGGLIRAYRAPLVAPEPDLPA